MSILAIDPGCTASAFVHYDEGRLIHFDKVPNAEMLQIVRDRPAEDLVIEQIASYGMAVGEEIFETVFWSGRFAEAWAGEFHRVKRMAVKIHHCHDSKARDPNIRQAIIDRYGGKDAAVGKKKNPGPLYGVADDVWAALALAITFDETRTAASAQETR